MSATGYTDSQIKFIKQKRSEGKDWKEITSLYNQEFLDNKTENAIRKTYKRFEDEDMSDNSIVENLEKSRKKEIENKKLKKVQTVLIDQQITMEEILSQLKDAIKLGGFKPIFIPKSPVCKTKKEMVMEIMYSDIHCGKKSGKYNSRVMEERIKEFSKVIMGEIDRNEKVHTISTIIFAIMGDLFENSYFHGLESMSACEFENSEQIRLITELTWKYFLVPLAKTGKKIIVPCLSDNHGRWGHNKTYNNPGKNNITWIVYNFFKFLSEQSGFKNVEFIIPEGIFCTIDIFGKTVMYEHADEVKGKEENSIESHIHKRSRQIQKHIDFFRMADKHESIVYNKGRIIINGSMCGSDSYALIKGYSGDASQTINFYINREQGSIFYKSFPVDLENIE